MTRGLIFCLSISCVCYGCNSYLTRRIDNIEERHKRDSIFIISPIIETRRQITKDSYIGDYESFELAQNLTVKALHYMLRDGLPVKFDTRDPINSWTAKIIADHTLLKFLQRKYDHFPVREELEIPSKANLVLIPYLIWVRTTEEYDDGSCGHNAGHNYVLDQHCYWTKAYVHLFLVDRHSRELVYYSQTAWGYGQILMPYEERVDRLFGKCIRPMLRNLR